MPNVSVSNTPGLYIGSGASGVLNSAQQLYSLLSNSGNVNFALINNNTAVQSYFIGNAGGGGGSYGNANVAAYLPTYTGTLDNSSTIISLTGNAATQATAINTINANLGAFQTYANATFGTSSYGNANVAAYLPTYGGNIGNIQTSYISALVVSTPTLNQVQSIIGSAGQDITLEPDGANNVNLNADTVRVGDNNTDFTLVTHGTGNLLLRTHSGDANQGNVTLVNGANGNIKLWPNGTGIVEIASNVKANYYLGDGSQLINLPVQSGTYSNTNVAAYLPTYTGSLAQSSTIIDLYSNAATQATAINTINANLGAFQTYANATFGPASYGNTQVAAYLPTYTGNIGNVNMTTDSRFIYSGNIDLRANNTSTTGGIIRIIASKGGDTYGGNVFIGGAVNEIGYGLYPYSKTTIQGYTVIKTGNVNPGVPSGNVLTISQGNVNLINTNNAGGNVSEWGGYLYVSNNISAAGSITSGSTMAAVDVTASGRVTAGNVTSTAGVFYANGQNILTGVAGNYSNVNVAAYLVSSTSIITNSNSGPIFIQNTGNTAAVRLWGGGSDLAIGASGNLDLGGGGTWPVRIDNTAGNVNYSASYHNFASVNGSFSGTTAVRVWGNIIATSNITGSYFIGDGSQLTNITSTYGNTQVAAYIQNTNLNSGGLNMLANVSYNNNYIRTAILETTTEKTSNIGAITGTVTIDANVGPIQRATLVGNITINTTQMSNFSTGESVTLVLTQDGTGSRLLTSNLKYAGGSKTLSTAAASVDTISITYDGSIYLAALVKGYS